MIRDRGYFIFDAFSKAIDSGADIIIRYKNKAKFMDPETGENIDLVKLLREKGEADILVLAGEKEKVPVRLIAMPVSEETANLRRMKAKKLAKAYCPSSKLLELLSWFIMNHHEWNIYITTIRDFTFNFELISTFYSFRWRIETIFKTWKSHLQFNKIHNVSEEQLT